ncbi:MAG TPA: DegQ family serine endoprotease [Acetobacteraceae bacterium]|nr:DegQ family serine endoprotease [Acetobacteraceae bacterium]
MIRNTPLMHHLSRAGLAGAVLAGCLALPPLHPALAQPAPAIIPPTRPMGPPDFADLVERVSPAVVRIAVVARAEPTAGAELPPQLRGTPLEEFLRRFWGRDGSAAPRARRTMGQGSGFIIAAEGLIVTNNHVVGNAERVMVELADGRDLEARVVGTDPQTDLALIRVQSDAPLPFVVFGDSDALRVGQWVLAMGNPFGLGGSATAGIVSARGRQIGAGPYDDFIQTDAPINPGNSGGPLFSAAGEVVGVNTAIFSPSGGNIGIGFAVPSNLVRRIVEDLRTQGRVERGWLGVSLQPLDPELARALGLPQAQGALIRGVEPGSPAARAGLRAGDVVVALDGRPVEDPRELAGVVAQARPGREVALTVLRDGQRREQTVALGEFPRPREVAGGGGRGGPVPVPTAGELGLTFLPRGGKPGQGEGAVIARVEPGSIAEQRGLQPGDVVLRVGDREVTTPQDVTEAVRAARREGRPAIALQIRRGEGQAFVALPLREASPAAGGG